MKRVLIALTLLAALAAPSFASDLWLGNAASGDSSGSDSLNCHTVGWANGHISNGTHYRFKSGAYNATLNPTTQGSGAAQTTFTGFTQDAGAVRLNDIKFGTVDADRGNYFTARWMKTTATLTGTVRALGDSIVSVIAPNAPSFMIGGKFGVYDSLTIAATITGTGQNHMISFAGQRSGVIVVGGHVTARGQWDWGSVSNRLTNSHITATVNTTSGQGDVHIVLLAAAADNVIVNNTFDITVTACKGYFFGMELYEGYRTVHQGNTWIFHMNGAAQGSRGILSQRDSSSSNRYTFNNYTVDGTGGTLSLMFTNGGSWSDGRGRNYFGYNFLKDLSPQPGTGALWFYDGANSDSIERNVIAANGQCALRLTGDLLGLVNRQNTYYTTGKSCVQIANALPSAGSIQTGNLFVCRPRADNTYNAGNDGAAIQIGSPAPFGSDSNGWAPGLAWKMGADANWPHYRLSGNYDINNDWQRETGNDAHSRAWGFNPGMFVDSRWATLDLHPARCGVLVSAAAPGGHWGALAPSGPCPH